MVRVAYGGELCEHGDVEGIDAIVQVDEDVDTLEAL